MTKQSDCLEPRKLSGKGSAAVQFGANSVLAWGAIIGVPMDLLADEFGIPARRVRARRLCSCRERSLPYPSESIWLAALLLGFVDV
jgi:hypothetical protein